MAYPLTLTLVALLLSSHFGLDPTVLPLPWLSRLGTAFHATHWHFLIVVVLAVLLVGIPIEVRLGRLVLQASWGVPCMLQTLLWGRAWPELAALSLLTTIAVFTIDRNEARPWKLWGPLGLAMVFLLLMLRAPVGAVAVSLFAGAVVGRWPRSEPVAVLGLAAGAALLLSWLA